MENVEYLMISVHRAPGPHEESVAMDMARAAMEELGKREGTVCVSEETPARIGLSCEDGKSWPRGTEHDLAIYRLDEGSITRATQLALAQHRAKNYAAGGPRSDSSSEYESLAYITLLVPFRKAG